MEHSVVADGQVHDSMAVGHRPWFGTKRPLAQNGTDRATAPQGWIVASAGDLARYLQVMTNGQDDVLSAAGPAAQTSSATPLPATDGVGLPSCRGMNCSKTAGGTRCTAPLTVIAAITIRVPTGIDQALSSADWTDWA
jgi:CubicO group peptidase (beta-lactamase class C family)